MATKGISSASLWRDSRGFMSLLSSAACEWFLMFQMFVNAALSYLLTKFASYCDLQTPCVLCSRLDHIFGNEKPGCYRSLLCSNHREEVSCSISCQIHDKLADVRGMCEECFMSIAMNNRSSESYKLMVGKLGVDFERCGLQSSYLKKKLFSGSLNARTCSCCNKQLKTKTNAQRLLQLTPDGFGASRANVKLQLPMVPGRSRLSRRNNLKRIRDKFSRPVVSRCSGDTAENSLSCVGYSELRFTSDSESEVLSSSDDDGSSLACEQFDSNECFLTRRGSNSMVEAQTDKATLVKQTQQAFHCRPSLLDGNLELDAKECDDVKCLASDSSSVWQDFAELNWEQPVPEPIQSPLPELISLGDAPSSSNVLEVPFGVSAERYKSDVPLSHMSSLHVLSELISLNDVPPKSNVSEVPLGVPSEQGAEVELTGTSDVEVTSITKNAQVHEASLSAVRACFSNVDVPSTSDYTGLSDVSNSAVSNKGRETSGVLAEQVDTRESVKVDETVKLPPPMLSTHEMDLSSKPSPRAYSHHDELQRSGAFSSEGIQVLQGSASLDRNDSGYESLEGSLVSEVEGENIIDQLKRQVAYDRRCLSSLYKELEEERNASAIAANQAMAMITRLQEEKASLHMEALQYLRMMEEQAEYDMDALLKANDLLAEKEKEVEDLETELEFYRYNFTDKSAEVNLHGETFNLRTKHKAIGNNNVASTENNTNVPSESKATQISEENEKHNDLWSSIFDFEDEKLYIKQCLENLQTKVRRVSNDGASSDMPNGVYSKMIINGVENPELATNSGNDNQKIKNDSSQQKHASTSNGSPPAHGRAVALVEGNHLFSEEKNSHFDSIQQKSSIHTGETILTTLENEISDLNDRLEALEADHDFVEHAFNSVRIGEEGLQFMKEIAFQLQELRKLEFSRR